MSGKENIKGRPKQLITIQYSLMIKMTKITIIGQSL